MNVRSLLLVLVATLAIASLAQVGWTADEYAPPPPKQPSAEAGHSDRGSIFGDCCAGYGADGCGDPCADCCPDYCTPGLQLYGDLLFLRPRNAGLEYAVPINGPIAPGLVPIQAGRTAALNPDFEPGFRVGGALGFTESSTIGFSFTHYEDSVDDAIATGAPFVIRSMVMHPSTLDAAADWLNASARQFIRFNLADIDYRHVFYSTECSSINYLVGIRYADLTQTFTSQFQSTITENVSTDVNFDGAGLRLGLEGERSGLGNMFLYGKAAASFLGGEFRASYLQSSVNNPLIAQTDWREARLVSILDCEVGLGWTGCSGHVRASAGYMVSAWLNVVKQSEFISAVQANQYHGPDKIEGNGLVFDGLVARLELRR
jgi:hypothetical protein